MIDKIDSGITFKTVKFRNFMSFSNIWTSVDLEQNGTTLLIGENLDDGGSSGAGKSTLINAVSYCLYDKIPANVSKDKLINRTNDKKITQMEVNLTFTKGLDEYCVRRWRGGSTGCQLLLNGVDITPASVNRGEDNFNAIIEGILGFSYNLFSQIILFNGNSLPFLDLSVGQQRTLIEELFRITMLSQKAVALKKIISELDKDIGLKKLLIQQQQKQNEIHKKHTIDAEERIAKWNKSQELSISDIYKKITLLSEIDFNSEESLHAEIANIKAINSELIAKQSAENSIFESKVRELKTKLISKKSEKLANEHISANKDHQEILKQISLKNKELEHLSEARCPYCLQDFNDSKKKIEELSIQNQKLITEEQLKAKEVEQLLLQNEESIQKKNTEIKQIEQEIIEVELTKTKSVYSDSILANQELLSEYTSALTFKDLNSLIKAKNELTTIADKVVNMEMEINPHIDAYNTLLKEGEVKVDIDELDKMNVVQDHQQFLLKLLTDKNSFIRKDIISKTIPFLNKQIAHYTEKLNLPHVISFQSDMSCEITQMGRDLDHGNLSNGEKKKLNLSLCLSFRDVLTYLHSKVNVLFTDEIDGGSLSGGDIDSLMSTLKSKSWDDNISVFIISHRPEFEGRCDNSLVIRKESGFSTVILQPL